MKTSINSSLLTGYDLEMMADYLTFAGLTDLRFGFLKRSLLVGKRNLTTTRISLTQGTTIVVKTAFSETTILVLAIFVGFIINVFVASVFSELPTGPGPGIISSIIAFVVLYGSDEILCFRSKDHYGIVTHIENVVTNKIQIDRFEKMMTDDNNN